MSRPVPNPGVLDIAPYTPGKTPGAGAGPQGVQAVGQRDAVRAVAQGQGSLQAGRVAGLEDYPEGTSRVLREAIGRSPSGSTPIASSAAPAPTKSSICWRTPISSTATRRSPPPTAFWCIRSRPWRTAPPTWSRPRTDFTADVDAILQARDAEAPSWSGSPIRTTRPAPTLPFDEVKRLRAGLPPHVLLVLDAAYSDYVSRNDYEIGIELVSTTENTVMTHTFSKIHGLAALRIGWMFGPANIVDACQPHSRSLQRLDSGDARRGRRDRGHRA